MTRARAMDAGETLVESLITIVVMGFAVTAMVGALFALNNASSLDLRQVTLQGYARAAADQAVAQISDPTNVAKYFDCPAVASTPSVNVPGLPSGYTVQIQILHSSSIAGVTQAPTGFVAPSFSSTCTKPDPGIKAVVVTVTAPAQGQYGAAAVKVTQYARKQLP